MKRIKLRNKLYALLIAGSVAVSAYSGSILIKELNDLYDIKDDNDAFSFEISEPIDKVNIYHEVAAPIVENMPVTPAPTPTTAPTPIPTPTIEPTPTLEPTTEPETTPEDFIDGNITFTENISHLSSDVSLINSYGYILNGDINEILAYGEQFQITGITTRAATLANVNFRKGPGTSYESINIIKNSCILGVYGRTANNWYLVQYNDIVGFVSGDYIQVLDVAYDSYNNVIYPNVPQLELAVTPNDDINVNIRNGNGTNYKKIGKISGDRKYRVLEKCSNGWYKIDYHGTEAYISGKYVKETYMLFGYFYRFVYLKNDDFLYDEYGNIIRDVSMYEGGKVYSEDEYRYLVSMGEDCGYILKSQCEEIKGKVVNIDLNLQLLEIIDNGQVILKTDIVTGKDETPSDQGLFKVYAMKYQTFLTGIDYNTYVDYFAPYNGGEGLHDAPWQLNHYGDTDYYHKGGSHGCINMPPDITPLVFSNINTGTKVLVHK